MSPEAQKALVDAIPGVVGLIVAGWILTTLFKQKD